MVLFIISIFIIALIIIATIITGLVLKSRKVKQEKAKETGDLCKSLTPEIARELAEKARSKVERGEAERKARIQAKRDELVQDKIDEVNEGILYQVNEFANSCGIGYIKSRWDGLTDEEITKVLKYFSDKGFTVEKRTIDGVEKDCILWEETKKEVTK